MVDSISMMIVVSSTGQSPSKFLIIGLRLARILEFEGKRTPSLETRRMSLVTSLDCDLSLMGLTLLTPVLIITNFIRRIYTSIGTLVIVKLLLNWNLTYLEFKKGLLASWHPKQGRDHVTLLAFQKSQTADSTWPWALRKKCGRISEFTYSVDWMVRSGILKERSSSSMYIF